LDRTELRQKGWKERLSESYVDVLTVRPRRRRRREEEEEEEGIRVAVDQSVELCANDHVASKDGDSDDGVRSRHATRNASCLMYDLPDTALHIHAAEGVRSNAVAAHSEGGHMGERDGRVAGSIA
jgi:hypothetical protein